MTWKQFAEAAARWRVAAGFVVAVVYFAAAQPSPRLAAAGIAVASAGMLLRTWAAGHLHKNVRLATSGPYAYARNPLYLGSGLAGAGFAIAGGVWWLGVLLALYLFIFFLPVVHEEESHLAKLFPEFREYANRVPRFGLRWPQAEQATEHFQWAAYRRNEEYNAFLGFLIGIALLIGKVLWVS